MKKFANGLGAFLMVSLLFIGYTAVAAELGGKDDPVVSLSYINDVLQPNILTNIDKVFAEKLSGFTSQIDAKISSLTTNLENKSSEIQKEITANTANDSFIKEVATQVSLIGASANPSNNTQYKSVKVSKSKTLKLKTGTEIVLRNGDATSINTIINLTKGEDTKNDTILKNNLYLSPSDTTEISATTEITVLIRGDYTIA